MKKLYLIISVLFFSFTASATIIVSVSTTPATCPQNNGSIIITASGGVEPYSYSMDFTTWVGYNVFDGLVPGTYPVSVMDATGETGSATAYIGQAPALVISASTTDASCGAGGTLTVIADGALPPYQYSIDGATFQISNYFPDLAPGTYDVYVTDNSVCMEYITVTIGLTNNITISAGPDVTVCNGSSINISSSGSGGGTYQWSPTTGLDDFTSQNPVASPPATTVYTVSYSVGSCVVVDEVIVTVDSPTADAGMDVTICNGGSIQLDGSGSGATTYSWSPSTGLSNAFIADPTASPLANTNYTLSITDAAGCIASDDIIVTVAHPTADAGMDVTICNGGSVQLNGSGSGATSYAWSPSAGLSDASIADPVASPVAATNYTLSITDAAGCIASDDVLIDVITVDVPVIELNGTDLTVTNVNGAASYTWQVLNGSIWEDIIPAATGTSYTPVVNASYRVKAVIGSCEAYSSLLLAGRPASLNQSGIYLYPNPTSTRLTLDEISLSQAWETLEIINGQGMRISTLNIRNQTSVSVNTAGYERGIYTARLRASDGKTTVFRFIKL